MAARDAKRALALVGAPFRPQGRDPRLGLDCLGLCLAAFRLPADAARRDYRMRGNHLNELETGLLRYFRRIGRGRARAGDLLLMSVAPNQLHLAVRTAEGFVHADATLRRVAETPGDPAWPVNGAYRRRAARKEER